MNDLVILFEIPWDVRHPGGVNQVVLNLMRQASLQSRKPLLLVQDWKHSTPAEEVRDGWHEIRYRLREPWNTTQPLRALLAFVFSLPRVVTTQRALLRRHRVDVVNVHYPTLAVLPFALMKLTGLLRQKLILSVHGLDLEYAVRSRGVQRGLWKLLIRGSDAIVACSANLMADMVRAFPSCAGKIRIIHNGVDPEHVHASMEKALAIEPDATRRYLLTIGTFEHKKGHDVLVRAFSRIARRFSDIDLIIVGRSAEERHKLAALVHELGMHERIRLLTDLPHGQAMRYMQQAAIFVLPSRAEPFGIVLLEAGLLQVPVIASAVGGIPEIITHAHDGLLVPPDDVTALSAAMSQLLSDPQQQALLSEALHQRVTTTFTWQQAFARYAALIENRP